MRYFKTTNASRRYRAGGLAFTFEPVSNIGGNWLGVLAVDDESTASIIATAGIPQVREILEADYDSLKKKPSQNSHFRASPGVGRPSTRQAPQVVGRVAQVASTPTLKPAPEPANAQLKTAVVEVPDELRLEGVTGKPKSRKR